jgi:hypothetical protein
MQTDDVVDQVDAAEPVDVIEEAYRERPTKPIRVRIQPQVFRLTTEGKRNQYRFWRDVHWTLDMDTPAEVYAFRDALAVFFRVVPRIGPEAAIQALKGVRMVSVVPGAGQPEEKLA